MDRLSRFEQENRGSISFKGTSLKSLNGIITLLEKSRFLGSNLIYMAGQISKENGKKGGRPKGYAAIKAETAREMIATKLSEHLGPIVDVMIKQAKKGDIKAIKELFDRAWGKSVQATETTNTGEYEPIFTRVQLYKIAKRTVADHEGGQKIPDMITNM